MCNVFTSIWLSHSTNSSNSTVVTQRKPYDENLKLASYTSITIQIFTHFKGSPTWRIAELSKQKYGEENIISRRLVTDILGIKLVELAPREHDHRELENVKTQYVELEWRVHKYPSMSCGPTRFAVTVNYDPPFDAVLGLQEWIRYGMDQKL